MAGCNSGRPSDLTLLVTSLLLLAIDEEVPQSGKVSHDGYELLVGYFSSAMTATSMPQYQAGGN